MGWASISIEARHGLSDQSLDEKRRTKAEDEGAEGLEGL